MQIDFSYAGRFQPPCKPADLDVERLVAVLIETGRVIRDEGETIDVSSQPEIAHRGIKMEGYASETPVGHPVCDSGLVERSGPHAL